VNKENWSQSSANLREPAMSFFSQFDSRQTRRLLLTGTVALPKPFPFSAVVRLEKGSLTLLCGEDPVEEWFVVIREPGDLSSATTRRVRASDVVALCFPGGAVADGQETAETQPTDENCDCSVDELDQGLWVLRPDVDRKGVRRRLGVDIADPKSCVQAIVFVPRNAPVYTVTELVQTAAAFSAPSVSSGGWEPGCSSCD
jgi:hypothetical protein